MKTILALLVIAVVLVALALGTSGEAELSFTTHTVAFCEDGEYTYCHDEIVVECGDSEYVLPKGMTEISCDGMEFSVPVITAASVFDKSWTDPRV